MIPGAVYTIWWIGLILTLVLFVPLAVYSLHRTWRSARSIQRYAAEALKAAGGIERNTRAVSALDDTIATATSSFMNDSASLEPFVISLSKSEPGEALSASSMFAHGMPQRSDAILRSLRSLSSTTPSAAAIAAIM